MAARFHYPPAHNSANDLAAGLPGMTAFEARHFDLFAADQAAEKANGPEQKTTGRSFSQPESLIPSGNLLASALGTLHRFGGHVRS
jgi:hypothetical protein